MIYLGMEMNNSYLGKQNRKAIPFACAPFRGAVCLFMTSFLAGCSSTAVGPGPHVHRQARSHADSSLSVKAPADENLITAVVEIGPFFLHSIYESGEGPGRSDRVISIKELVANGKTVWTEPRLGLNKELAESFRDHPLYKEGLAFSELAEKTAAQQSSGQNPENQAEPENRLYWLRGIKLEVVEDVKVLPYPEFLCHSIISFDNAEHRRYFPKSSSVSGQALANFTQGATDVIFPQGYGIPLNDNEKLLLDFWTLNRTSDEPRLVKGRWTVYLVADSDLTGPMQALNWYRSGVALLVDKSQPAHPHGMHKRNSMHDNKVHLNEKGEEITYHWMVPRGRHSYLTMHPEFRFDLQGPMIAAGAHLHPFAEKMSLVESTPEGSEKEVFTINSQTGTDGGIRIENIDYMTWPADQPVLSKDKNIKYGWRVTYNNTTGADVDAMAGATIYFSDLRFEKPDWANDLQRDQ